MSGTRAKEQMDFSKYSNKIRAVRESVDSASETFLRNNALLKIVHGLWKRYSQAAEHGQKTFTSVLNLNRALEGMTIEEAVKELREFSFEVEWASPDPETLEAFGTKVIGPNIDSVYVLRFTL